MKMQLKKWRNLRSKPKKNWLRPVTLIIGAMLAILLTKVVTNKKERSLILEKVDDILGAETSVYINNS